MNSLIRLQLPAAVQGWTGHDTQLLVVAALGIALIVVLIASFKLHPFLALILGSAFVGLASGVELAKIITNFEDGVGGVLKEVGLLIALGAMLGKLLADSGGANRVVDTPLAKSTGNKAAGTKTVWSIMLAGSRRSGFPSAPPPSQAGSTPSTARTWKASSASRASSSLC